MKFAALVGLVAGLWCYHLASGELHSLKYFFTAVSGDVDFAEFTIVGLVDDGQFMYFDSNIKKAVPKTDWMKAEGEDYWNQQTQVGVGQQQIFANNIQVAKERFNQSHSNGIHTAQLMYGCELVDDGTTKGYFQYGYDGEDFISLDKSTRTWTPGKQQAFITKHKWEVTGSEANYWTDYLKNTCIEWLGKYVRYGKETLEREVPPEVSVLQKGSGVVCHATGFYPDRVMITWKRDGEEMQDDVDVGETLPNQDGTFQKSAVLKVSPEEKETKGRYICEVAHKSGELITVSLDEMKHKNSDSGSVPFGLIIGVIVGLLVVAIGGVGVIVWKKRGKPQRDGFTPAGIDDGSSNNSSNQA